MGWRVHHVHDDPAGVLLGALVAFVIFGRRAQRTVYRKAEGQTGAAAWALDNLRGKWRVTPGVAATGNLDAVHRVIGRPGVIFVGEDQRPASNHCWLRRKSAPRDWSGTCRSTTLSSATAMARFRWPLERHLTRLPANITVKQMDTVESRLAALGSRAGAGVMPKGPLPTTAKMRSVQRTVRRK